jgi:uncharacterized UBP type Zn finger protein
MFGLPNFSGSCWVNACLQSVFRIPDVQTRYTDGIHDPTNPIDMAMYKIWSTKGDGLKDFFDAVRTDMMPAGQGIGDSHELFVYLCDKLPFLDKLCRFKVADSIQCNNCKKKELKEDMVAEFSLSASGPSSPISDCIMNTMTPHEITDWICETCKEKGCMKQQLIGSFPQVMVFHMVSTQASVNYSSILLLNKIQYALLAVCCYNGFHWWSYGRNKVGESWYTLDDTRVEEHGPKEFPLSNRMRLLIYYRLNN